MKQLSDTDIEQMVRDTFIPDDNVVRRDVRRNLHLSTRIVPDDTAAPEYANLDLHQKTEQQAWDEIMELAVSGVKNATIITGASGILRKKFPEWATNSILAPYIISFTPINNGSFSVRFRKK